MQMRGAILAQPRPSWRPYCRTKASALRFGESALSFSLSYALRCRDRRAHERRPARPSCADNPD